MNPLKQLFTGHRSDSDFDKGYQKAVSDFKAVLEASSLSINKSSLDEIGSIFYQAFQNQTIVSEMELQPNDVTIKFK